MGKFDYARLSKKQRDEVIEPLIEALHRLKKKDQLREFVTRLLTPSEIIMLGRRLQAAEGLVMGKSYYTIRKETGIGFSTIRNVDSWLEHAVRDYHDFRAEQRRLAAEAKAERNLQRSRRYFARSDMMLFELLAQAAVATSIELREPKKGKSRRK